jgi:hypothetical protein
MAGAADLWQLLGFVLFHFVELPVLSRSASPRACRSTIHMLDPEVPIEIVFKKEIFVFNNRIWCI